MHACFRFGVSRLTFFQNDNRSRSPHSLKFLALLVAQSIRTMAEELPVELRNYQQARHATDLTAARWQRIIIHKSH